MKKITILLTRYSDPTSVFVYFLTGRGYTHSSIALGENMTEYYSFNYTGFTVETIEKHRKRGVERSLSYSISVPDDVYDKIEKAIAVFKANKEDYHYTKLGVICCVLHMPLRRRNRYFCSQFVAELLENSGAVTLFKKPHLFTPNNFTRLFDKHPACVNVALNVV